MIIETTKNKRVECMGQVLTQRGDIIYIIYYYCTYTRNPPSSPKQLLTDFEEI